VQMTPVARELLAFSGNSAHSSGFWYSRGGTIYFGGKLYEDATGRLWYNGGRQSPARNTCAGYAGQSAQNYNCKGWLGEDGFTVLEDTKVFLSGGVGLSHWGSRVEVSGFEAHDVGLGLAILAERGHLTGALIQCRTGSPLDCVNGNACDDASIGYRFEGSGFDWYDTGQAHILTHVTFRNCGAPSARGGGCGDDCGSTSSTWHFLCHSDEFVPEYMMATAVVGYEDCGRRFRCRDFVEDNGGSLNSGMDSTVSERISSQLDVDGSASELAGPTIIGNAAAEAGDWWRLGEGCEADEDGQFWLCPQPRGTRQIGSATFTFDQEAQSQVGQTVCGNGNVGYPCTPVGFVQHWGRDGLSLGAGLPLTPNGETTGPVGGFGWHIELIEGAPVRLTVGRLQVRFDTSLMLSLSYPPGTSFAITAYAASWCNTNWKQCEEAFQEVGSPEAVRASAGNTYHWDGSYLYVRLVQANPNGWAEWSIEEEPTDPFVRDGITLPRFDAGSLVIDASCTPNPDAPAYCLHTPAMVGAVPAACTPPRQPVAYDLCCLHGSGDCEAPGGIEVILPLPPPPPLPSSPYRPPPPYPPSMPPQGSC